MSAAPIALLLASGKGSRFDPSGSKNKLCERLANGSTVLATSAANLLAAGLEVVVVAPEDERLRAAVAESRITWCANPDPALGMGHSIAIGVRATRSARAWLVALGDMPFIAPATIGAVLQALEDGTALIAAPEIGGVRGHPVAFSRALYDELLALSGDAGGKALFARHAVTAVRTDDYGILRDIDRPDDLPV